MTGDQEKIEIAHTIVEQIKPLLAGRPPGVQGLVLADLLAIWLAGHQVVGDQDATRTLRDELLAAHCLMVRELTIIDAAIMATTPV
jgi:hypothetical protein